VPLPLEHFQPAAVWRALLSGWSPPAWFALAVALATTSLAPAASFDVWHTGHPAGAHSGKTRAGLFLSGGGGDVTAAWKWFVACAGGGDIVILRASGADGYNDYIYTKIGGVNSVVSIRFNDISAARDARVLELIAQADGIFLAGGDQSKYVTYWKDTPVGAALNAHLRAGKPLGGTSAGLAVLGHYYFAALEDSVTSEAALANPFDAKVTLGRDFISAPALVGVITDSHLTARQRLGRLIAFLARLTPGAEEKTSRLVGLGIDEATAVCIEPDASAHIFSEKKGLAWLVVPTRPPERLVAGQPLLFRNVQVIGLGPESTLDLKKMDVTRPVAQRLVTAMDGRLVDATDVK
jgi:beta-aspartyl-peptidase (threonine type)